MKILLHNKVCLIYLYNNIKAENVVLDCAALQKSTTNLVFFPYWF